MGKLLQNYTGYLESQKKNEMAFNIALAGEQEYLKDNDFIGGITCRIKGAENLLHQEKYPESYEFIVPYHDKFSKILENHQNESLRGHLNLVLSMIAIYNNRHEEFILTSLDALT